MIKLLDATEDLPFGHNTTTPSIIKKLVLLLIKNKPLIAVTNHSMFE
jgi:hypothetical protein